MPAITFPDGVLIINKHAGPTSHDIVGMVRRLYGTRAVGHAGTLDPMATGVLVVLLGRATKAAEYLSGAEKEYSALLRLGMSTDTQDITGNILSSSTELPSADKVSQVCSEFVGDIFQIPPMYSALKVGGHKLVDLARQGVTIERQQRSITVQALHCTPTGSPTDYHLQVRCSGGTYIRTLCSDIGERLGCGGVMASLERQRACGFSLKDSISIEELESMSLSERLFCLVPTERLFISMPAVHLTPFYDRLCGNGCAVLLSKLKLSAFPCGTPLGTRVRLCHPDGTFFALGEVVEGEGGPSLKAVKTFILPTDQKR